MSTSTPVHIPPHWPASSLTHFSGEGGSSEPETSFLAFHPQSPLNPKIMTRVSDEKLLARQAWIEASRFHDLSEGAVLREVAERVSQYSAERPVVLLDLDSTLYEVGSRTHQILKEWSAVHRGGSFEAVRAVLDRIQGSQVGYSLRDTFLSAGLELASAEVLRAWESVKEFWNHRFFTSEYLKYDHAYPGAAEFAHELYRLGAEMIYLTGRDEPNMGAGTRSRLKQDGFPWEIDRTHLLLKAAPHLDDLFHKKEAATFVRKKGRLIASFENEPKNLAALHELFPDAMHVFVDTVYSDHPTEPRDGLYRIKAFR